MIRKSVCLIILLFLILGVALAVGCRDDSEQRVIEFTDQLPIVEADPDVHVTFSIKDEGYNIYAPYEGWSGYRYGPSIIYYPDGSVDAWFASNAMKGELDWFTYKHSEDGGKTWSDEKIVLQPTGGSYDFRSVCDPGVIYINGYYYLGYTSTICSSVNNNVFVARSKNPDGPFEKWDGEGWGGMPEPIVYYDEYHESWGAGEPSFVVLGDTLYMYYTWMCPEGDYTMVATADATSENWPATLECHGVAYQKLGSYRQDSCDVVYIEDLGKFIALSTYERFTADSGICVMESNDGIHFTQVDIIRTGTMQYLHNMGISKRSDGHIQLDDELCFIGYGYSDGSEDAWGKWATRFQSIEIKSYSGEITPTDAEGKGTLNTDFFWPEQTQRILNGITTPTSQDRALEVEVDGEVSVVVKTMATDKKQKATEDSKNIKIYGYDKSIVQVDGLTVKGLKEGTTILYVEYKGFYTTVTVTVYNNLSYLSQSGRITEFKAINDVITVSLASGHKPQIRCYAALSNGDWGEIYFSSKSYNLPDGILEENAIQFYVEDTSLLEVSTIGVIKPIALGTTTVTVTVENGMSFTVTVNIVE